ncbi:hypothetical protein [Endozoicomonas numazuensis]|uniref:Uncharacterized protein n=1 Tax=Endozoicomonas numazuensis TaxID=1137799 RepID=A0A081NKT8_9GAMM|nr:hypothetical protein [Endozoicomonas numazuensis]KEQ19061.1 hypothetical protein GZ78_03270 [Endozoicomonas numazuensis]
MQRRRLPPQLQASQLWQQDPHTHRLLGRWGHAFKTIRIPAGSDTGQIQELEAHPEAMILHRGSSIMGAFRYAD